MASVFVSTTPSSEVEYSLVDGRVYYFVVRGDVLYDETREDNVDDWQQKLVEFVKENGLDRDIDGRGLHAFVYRMQKDGLIEENM